jgi:hypothetical protein
MSIIDSLIEKYNIGNTKHNFRGEPFLLSKTNCINTTLLKNNLRLLINVCINFQKT